MRGPCSGQRCPNVPSRVWRERELLGSRLPKVKPFGVTVSGHQGEGATRTAGAVVCRGQGSLRLQQSWAGRPLGDRPGWAVGLALTWTLPLSPSPSCRALRALPSSSPWALSGHSRQHSVPSPPPSPVHSPLTAVEGSLPLSASMNTQEQSGHCLSAARPRASRASPRQESGPGRGRRGKLPTSHWAFLGARRKRPWRLLWLIPWGRSALQR